MIADIFKKARQLLIYMRPVRGRMYLSMLFSAVSEVAALWLIADLLGNLAYAVQMAQAALLWQAALYALPWIGLCIITQSIADYLGGQATIRATAYLRKELFHRLSTSPMSASRASHTGEKLSCFTNDIPAAMSALIKTISKPINLLITGGVGFTYVLLTNWRLALVVVAMGVYFYLYSVFFAKRLHDIAVTRQKALAEMETRLKDTLDGAVVTRMYGMRDTLEEWMEATSQWLRRTGVRWAWISSHLGGFNNASYTIAARVLIYIAGLSFLSGALEFPELIRVSEMAGMAAGVFGISRLLVDIQQSLAGAERVFAQLDEKPERQGGDTHAGRESGSALSLRDVHFRYGERQVLTGFSLDVSAGEWIALIGPSGSGKSTVLRLLQGLYEKESGEIDILGVPLADWALPALRGQVALVPQEPVLFPGTILDNITIGDDHPDSERAMHAAKEAGADGFINEFPEGYDTQVAERGGSLSGGQRQRIAIARALYRNAPILLLDEITSALDTESERLILQTLSTLKGKRTMLLVTHRAAALAYVDRTVRV